MDEARAPVSAEAEEGRWIVRGGQAFEATDADAFDFGDQQPPAGLGQPVRLEYNNPFRLEIERVWFDGKIVYAVELGELDIDPASVKIAQEDQIVYGVDLDDRGRPR